MTEVSCLAPQVHGSAWLFSSLLLNEELLWEDRFATEREIILQVPNLSAGVYHLRIMTQRTRGGTLLKEPRTIYFETDLIVTE